jgi:DNA-binding NarL/FixJ family response regulator
MPNSSKRTLLLVEDDEFMRQSAPEYLAAEGFHVLLADAAAGALAVAREHCPEVVIVDLVIPPDAVSGRSRRHARHGLQLVKQLKEMSPAPGVVVFSAHEEHGKEILQLVSQGVRGMAYILKGQPAGDLLEAIRGALAGEVHFAPEVRINTQSPAEAFLQLCTLPEERAWIESGVKRFSNLTARELEIARLLAASQTTPAVAKALHIESKTAEAHIRNLYAKLGLDKIDNQAPQLNARSLLVKIFSLHELQCHHSEQR